MNRQPEAEIQLNLFLDQIANAASSRELHVNQRDASFRGSRVTTVGEQILLPIAFQVVRQLKARFLVKVVFTKHWAYILGALDGAVHTNAGVTPRCAVTRIGESHAGRDELAFVSVAAAILQCADNSLRCHADAIIAAIISEPPLSNSIQGIMVMAELGVGRSDGDTNESLTTAGDLNQLVASRAYRRRSIPAPER